MVSMQVLQVGQIQQVCLESGLEKQKRRVTDVLGSSAFAGMIIAFGAASACTVSFSMGSPSLGRLAAGLVFPFGLAIIVLLGGDLFTGNVLLAVPVFARQMRLRNMLKNLVLVYAGNAAGAAFVAAAMVAIGQLALAQGALAQYAVGVATAKISLPFFSAFLSGILCNLLVCSGVLLSYSATSVCGKIAGCYLPVFFFVICGFEHCVANMYYIPVALFAAASPQYAAFLSGLDLSSLSWQGYLVGNLLPVTLGNMAGGLLIAAYIYMKRSRDTAKTLPAGK